jgi:predicted AAA+ superfamily ATPase
MSFAEFVLAIGGKRVAQALDEAATENLTLITHDLLWDLLTTYYVVGGMPKAVAAYQAIQNNPVQTFTNVREIQNNLILAYMNDINKHCGKVNAMHIARTFENIPKQLSANLDVSVKRYLFNDVLPGKRGYA